MFYITENELKKWLQWMLGDKVMVGVYCERMDREMNVEVKMKGVIEEIVQEICRGDKGVIVKNERVFFNKIWDIMMEYIDNEVEYQIGCYNYEVLDMIGLRFKTTEVIHSYSEELIEEWFDKAVREGVVEIVENVI